MYKHQSLWTHTVSEDHVGVRLDVFWAALLEDQGISRARIQKWIKQGRACIQGISCQRPKTRLEAGQQVSLEPVCQNEEVAPHKDSLTIIYQDQDILVIDKPAGLTVHPAPSVTEPTLVNILVHHFPELARMDPQRPGIVHRLDKDTSGLMIIARNEATRLALVQAFARREIRKEYLALVQGVPSPPEGDINDPIGRHPSIKTRMAVVHKGGRPAASSYKVLWASPGKWCSLVRVRIHTGRTHQVRVHMARRGHPLLGDAVYGGMSSQKGLPVEEHLLARQMLHAWRLGLSHPTTGRPMSLMLPPPQDMLDVLHQAAQEPWHIGLTGMCGSGKTTVLGVFKDMGIPVWSADACVARLYAVGGDGWEMLRGRFGEQFVPDTRAPVDKAGLFLAMQQDTSLRREVEGMIHPMILWELEQFLAHHSHSRMTISELPLLAETGWHTKGLFHHVVGVFCPDAQRHTLLQTRGWAEDTIATVDSWQWSQLDKLAGCGLIIPNDGNLQTLTERTKQVAAILTTLNHTQRQHGWEALCQLVGYASPEALPVSLP